MYGYHEKKLHVYHLGVKGYNLIFFSMIQFEIVKKVIDGIYPGVATTQLDILAAEIAASMTTIHPDYAVLAARIEVSNLHKETKKIFSGRCLVSCVLPLYSALPLKLTFIPTRSGKYCSMETKKSL